MTARNSINDDISKVLLGEIEYPELYSTRAFSAGPEIYEPSDAELLQKCLNPREDIFEPIVDRDWVSGGFRFRAGADAGAAMCLLLRARDLLESYKPASPSEAAKLADAFVRFWPQAAGQTLASGHARTAEC